MAESINGDGFNMACSSCVVRQSLFHHATLHPFCAQALGVPLQSLAADLAQFPLYGGTSLLRDEGAEAAAVFRAMGFDYGSASHFTLSFCLSKRRYLTLDEPSNYECPDLPQGYQVQMDATTLAAEQRAIDAARVRADVAMFAEASATETSGVDEEEV